MRVTALDAIDFSSCYVNSRRLLEILPKPRLQALVGSMGGRDPNELHDFRSSMVLAQVKDELVLWLKANVAQVHPIDLMAAQGTLAPGQFFTAIQSFFGNAHAKPGLAQRLWTKLELEDEFLLEIPIQPQHVLSGSPRDRMSGRNRLFVFGVVEKVEQNVIQGGAYYVGTVCPRGVDPLLPPPGWYWRDYQQIPLQDIDAFSRIGQEAMPDKKDLAIVKTFSEEDVKFAVAELISEQAPKDWGGERSDLFSANVSVRGRPATASFLFKGPGSGFTPMTMKHLGKRGDQIDRLFCEGSDLCVLQHCHDVTPAVRNTMRAYALSMERPRLFTILDGIATLRLMRAYGKLGQSHVAPPP